MVGHPKLTVAPLSEPVSLTLAKQQLQISAGDTSQDDYISGVLIPAAREVAEGHTAKAYLFQQYREYYHYFPGREWGPVAEMVPQGYYGHGGIDHDHRRRERPNYLEISRSPLRKIIRVQYLDQAGATQTLDPAQYVVNNAQDPAQIDRAAAVLGGEPWPATLRQVNSVWVDYVAGYGGNVTVSMTNGYAVLNSVTGYSFSAEDVGLPISVPGAKAANTALVSTIASVTSGVATLADNAGAAVTGETAFLGRTPLNGDVQAMLLLIGHWYENRLPVARKDVAELPYAIQHLLDLNRVYYQP